MNESNLCLILSQCLNPVWTMILEIKLRIIQSVKPMSILFCMACGLFRNKVITSGVLWMEISHTCVLAALYTARKSGANQFKRLQDLKMYSMLLTLPKSNYDLAFPKQYCQNLNAIIDWECMEIWWIIGYFSMFYWKYIWHFCTSTRFFEVTPTRVTVKPHVCLRASHFLKQKSAS